MNVEVECCGKKDSKFGVGVELGGDDSEGDEIIVK